MRKVKRQRKVNKNMQHHGGAGSAGSSSKQVAGDSHEGHSSGILNDSRGLCQAYRLAGRGLQREPTERAAQESAVHEMESSLQARDPGSPHGWASKDEGAARGLIRSKVRVATSGGRAHVGERRRHSEETASIHRERKSYTHAQAQSE